MDELERQARSLVAGLAGCAGVVLELGDRKGMEQLIITALRAAHDAGRAEGEGSADSLRARLAYVQGGQEQVAAVSAWLAVSTVREVVIGRTKDGSGIRAQAQVWEGAGRVEAECVGEDVALALEALGAALK